MKLSKIRKHVDRADALTEEGNLNRARLHLGRASQLMFSSPVELEWTILYDGDGLQKKHKWSTPNHQERPERLEWMDNGCTTAKVPKKNGWQSV